MDSRPGVATESYTNAVCSLRVPGQEPGISAALLPQAPGRVLPASSEARAQGLPGVAASLQPTPPRPPSSVSLSPLCPPPSREDTGHWMEGASAKAHRQGPSSQ